MKVAGTLSDIGADQNFQANIPNRHAIEVRKNFVTPLL